MTSTTHKTPPKVALSNGFDRYHLSGGAAELNRMGTLVQYITGAYPTPAAKKFFALPGILKAFPRFKRLLDREEDIPLERLASIWHLEYLQKLGVSMAMQPRWQKLGLKPLGDRLRLESFWRYGELAKPYVEQAHAAGANVYHYRSGYGGASADRARELGMVLLCDHTIAHPGVLPYMINNLGRYPEEGAGMRTPFWRPVQDDLGRSDYIFVNSDFVKTSFVHQGWDPGRVYVVYQGLDQKFTAVIPEHPPMKTSGPLRLFFAGTLKRRKGSDVLLAAMRQLMQTAQDWTLEIAGGGHADVFEDNKDFFADPRVKFLGLLSREELAHAMSRNEVFIFPTLAEGSARVIFEAMACGMYIITTPNAGSIIEDGTQGRLIPTGDAKALKQAILDAGTQRDTLFGIGQRNAAQVRQHYLQSDFGFRMVKVYQEILSRGPQKPGPDHEPQSILPVTPDMRMG